MKRIYKYKTGLCPFKPDQKEPKPPYRGKAWKAILQEFCRNNKEKDGKEVIILAKSRERAQYVLDLITASLFLFEGQPPVIYDRLIAFREKDLEDDENHFIKNRRYGTLYVRLACAIAAKASYRCSKVYAISKYNFSTSLCSLNLVDLDPSFSPPHISLSHLPCDHINYSHSIVSAYSAIEELGLEIRASAKSPSMIYGKWNPKIKEDLETRLKKSGININENISWTLRGTKRKIEKTKVPNILKKEPWSYGLIRDAEMKVVDAIVYVSWLRSKVASHKTKDISKVLSVYDVNNAQSLARRLILESMGFWRYFSKKNKR